MSKPRAAQKRPALFKAWFGRVVACALALFTLPLHAHPHVFVDGRIDFVFGADATLQGIEVTWLYDPFETLYVLSNLEIDPGQTWTLTEAQKAKVIAHESDWSDEFNGAARLMQDGDGIALAPPTDFAARLVQNRLEVRFRRALNQPLEPSPEPLEVTFYEESFFYAFSIAEAPLMLGTTTTCTAHVVPFDPDTQAEALLATLRQLEREESPQTLDIGRSFTDRIYLSCA